jgi:hypothetical protein
VEDVGRLDTRRRDDGKPKGCGCIGEFVGCIVVCGGLVEFKLAERVKARGPC